jgi:hypothetical protein
MLEGLKNLVSGDRAVSAVHTPKTSGATTPKSEASNHGHSAPTAVGDSIKSPASNSKGVTSQSLRATVEDAKDAEEGGFRAGTPAGKNVKDSPDVFPKGANQVAQGIGNISKSIPLKSKRKRAGEKNKTTSLPAAGPKADLQAPKDQKLVPSQTVEGAKDDVKASKQTPAAQPTAKPATKPVLQDATGVNTNANVAAQPTAATTTAQATKPSDATNTQPTTAHDPAATPVAISTDPVAPQADPKAVSKTDPTPDPTPLDPVQLKTDLDAANAAKTKLEGEKSSLETAKTTAETGKATAESNKNNWRNAAIATGVIGVGGLATLAYVDNSSQTKQKQQITQLKSALSQAGVS